ncbi:universal stress protein [soil metagenome]
MIKKLLVAIDASEAAASAVRAAEQIALQLGGELVILHVVDVASVTTAADGIHRFQPTIDEMRRAGQALLNNTRARIALDLDVTLLLLEGDPADTIVGAAAAQNADLIVIGTDSRGRLAHFLLGSTTDSVIRRAGCPVLAARRDVKQTASHEQHRAGAVA